MPSPHILVWDLDRTLGLFDPLNELSTDGEPVEVSVRPDLHATLKRLGAAGFIHRVLTMASPHYAQLALRGTGLEDAFVAVEGRQQRLKGDVAGIAAEHGLAEPEWAHHMLFVGDHLLHDTPRHPQVVFHFEPQALMRSAVPCGDLFLRLREHGDGSLSQGFASLFDGGTPLGRPEGVMRCSLDGVPTMLLAKRGEECPVIAFEHPPAPEAVPSRHLVRWG